MTDSFSLVCVTVLLQAWCGGSPTAGWRLTSSRPPRLGWRGPGPGWRGAWRRTAPSPTSSEVETSILAPLTRPPASSCAGTGVKNTAAGYSPATTEYSEAAPGVGAVLIALAEMVAYQEAARS